jgi:hypothetical protein
MVEGCTAIDTTELKRVNLLAPGVINKRGALEWRGGGGGAYASVGYAITIGNLHGVLRVDYQMPRSGANFGYAIRLVTTSCNLGGVRWWFICPLSQSGVACGRRVRKLYLRSNYFGCRHCHKLAYRSSQESDSRVYAALRQGGHQLGKVEGMSAAQLMFELKLLTAGQKR